MKRSSSVTLGGGFLTAVLAFSAGACSSSDPDHHQICVDKEHETRVEDRYCPNDAHGFYWYYMPYHVSAPPVVSRVTGGSYVKPAGSTVRAPARGGFGGRSSGGGG